MPMFFVPADAIAPPSVHITGVLLDHLRLSLRVHAGDSLTVTDGRGTRYRVQVTEVTARHLAGLIQDTMSAPVRTSPSIIVAQALLKGEKMDWVIQKATELGVEEIIPVHTARSIVQPRADRLDHQMARWQRIALEAAQQSERWSIPPIHEPVTLAQLVTRVSPAHDRIVLAERTTGVALTSIALPSDATRRLLLLVGPEGGWEEKELGLVRDHGYVFATLGTGILRAETAALAALSVLQARMGQLG